MIRHGHSEAYQFIFILGSDSMTIQEASERYMIPIKILKEYESWGLCGAVKKVMGAWQYDDTDLERLSIIMTLHDIGFTTEEVASYVKAVGEKGEEQA